MSSAKWGRYCLGLNVLISQLFPHKNAKICLKLSKNTEIIAICYWSEFSGVFQGLAALNTYLTSIDIHSLYDLNKHNFFMDIYMNHQINWHIGFLSLFCLNIK